MKLRYLVVNRLGQLVKVRRSWVEDLWQGELPAQDLAAGDAEPVIEQSGVHLAEIGVVPQVAVLEIGEARMGTDKSGLDATADKKHRGAGAMIGATAAILMGAATKFGKGHNHQSIAMPALREIAIKGRNGVGNVAEKSNAPASKSGLDQLTSLHGPSTP